MLKNVFRVSGLLMTLLLLSLLPVSAGAPAGHYKSLDADMRNRLIQNLDSEGYMARFKNGQDLKRGISAYLWDNRQWLKNVDFHNSKQIDVLVCLMIKKGYGNFADYAGERSFMAWCEGMVGD